MYMYFALSEHVPNLPLTAIFTQGHCATLGKTPGKSSLFRFFEKSGYFST